MQEQRQRRNKCFIQCFTACFKCTRAPDRNLPPVPPRSPSPPSSLLSQAQSELALSTYPPDNLRDTVMRAIASVNAETNADTLAMMVREIESELESTVPINSVEEQYDYCIVSSDSDSEEAIKFWESLSKSFGLTGFMVSEKLGTDRIQTFQDAARRSTRIFFFITERFLEDPFCSFLLKLVSTPAIEKSLDRKPIYIMSSPDVDIPKPLRIKNRLLWNSPQFDLTVPREFEQRVKDEKIERSNKLKAIMDEERLQIVDRLVKEKLGVFV